MKARFGEPRKFKSDVVPPDGNYALEAEPPKGVHWDHCREQFAAKFNELTPGFYFSHPSGKSFQVAEFLAKFESVLDLKEPSSYCRTDKEKVLWIEPSKFWLNCPMKRSLLTILLRCGINYLINEDNFDGALFGDFKESAYTKETRSATLRFMFGFTRFVGTISTISSSATVVKHGWREEFHKLDDSTIRRRLVLPEGEQREVSIIGVESLWT